MITPISRANDSSIIMTSQSPSFACSSSTRPSDATLISRILSHAHVVVWLNSPRGRLLCVSRSPSLPVYRFSGRLLPAGMGDCLRRPVLMKDRTYICQKM